MRSVPSLLLGKEPLCLLLSFSHVTHQEVPKAPTEQHTTDQTEHELAIHPTPPFHTGWPEHTNGERPGRETGPRLLDKFSGRAGSMLPPLAGPAPPEP